MCKGTSALENYLVKDDTDTMYARGKLTSWTVCCNSFLADKARKQSADLVLICHFYL
jgi:hypothetical protein